MTVRDLIARQRRLSEAEESKGAAMFLGRPDRWYASPHWRCTNGHISTTYLKSEERGALCLACGQAVMLTSPEDKGEP